MFADASLLFIAIIWGATFPMVKGAVENFPVFSFLAIRFAIATVALLLLSWRTLRTIPRKWVVIGIMAGLVNFTGFALQTFGLKTIAPGRAAFITGLYGALVPFMLVLLGKIRINRMMWVAIVFSVIGLTLLFWNDLTFSLASGDVLVILCAFAFAFQIVIVGLFPKELDPKPMATLQAFACFGAAAVMAVFTDHPLTAIPFDTLGAAAFTGILGTALALVVQAWAQRHTPTYHAALILCTEPVWGAMASVALFGEVFTPLAVAGCILMLISMVAPDLISALQIVYRRRYTEPESLGLPAR
jgi:drug/metabolite transporter (DMT)-like permease